MFRLNLKIAWRNLLKYKAYTLTNVVGLALGLAGFIFILLYINYEKNYDTWNPELKNVYQVQEFSDYYSADKKAHLRSEIDNRLSLVAGNLPQVKAITMINISQKKNGIKLPGKPAMLQGGLRRVDSLFFEVFPYEFKYGNAKSAFLQPDVIVLKEHLALQYFGNVNPVGKKINFAGGFWNKEERPYIVTGVLKENVMPSVIDFEGLVFEGGSYFSVNSEIGDPTEMYVKTTPITDVPAFNKLAQKAYLPIKDQLLKKEHRDLAQSVTGGSAPYIKFAPLAEVHQNPVEQKSWKDTLKPVSILSLLLLIVSVINFINLATAQAAGRAKEIGVKRVVGAYRRSIILQFLVETILQSIIAMFVALLLIEVSLPTINSFFVLKLSLFKGPELLMLTMQLIGLVILTGLLTGFYPALFLSAYKPHEVLKGNFSNGEKGVFIRKGLVAIQFIVAVSFIVGILVINYQLKYLKNRDNGFTSSGLINIRADLRSHYYDELRRIDGVKYVGFASSVIGDNMASVQQFKYKGEEKGIFSIGLSMDGLKALDARLVAGRTFSPSVVRDTIDNAVINESAARLFRENMVGKTILVNDSVRVNIIGVIKDIQVEGFENAVKPSIYAVQTERYKGGVGGFHKQSTLVRFDPAKTKTVVAGIDKIFTEMNVFYPASYSFIENDFSAVLIEHERFEKMVSLFSLLSLTLSLFGLFALAAFITKQRTKEIAVRKILGAEHRDILLLLNKGYVWMVLIANVIAFPLSYILINKWLESFAYRIQISPLPFISAFIASVGITILTVSLQARKAIKTNPVNALKYE